MRPARAIIDRNSGTSLDNLSEAQKDELLSCFRFFDKDNSGFLDNTEVANAVQLLGIATSDDEVNRIMSDIDSSGDNKVNIEEFVSFMAKQLMDKKHLLAEMDMAFDGAPLPRARARGPRPSPRTARPPRVHHARLHACAAPSRSSLTLLRSRAGAPQSW